MLTGLVVAGGSVYLGFKTYAQRSKKKATFLRLASTHHNTSPTALLKAKHLTLDIVRAFSNIERRQHQGKLAANGIVPVNELERNINRRLLVSTAIMGGAALGVTVFPVLSILGIAGVLYMEFPIFRMAYQELRKGRVTTHVADTILILGLLGAGYILLATCIAVSANLLWKLLVRTENHSRRQLVNMFGQQPQQVWIEYEGGEVQLPLEQVRVGHRVVVNAGEMIPVDGRVTAGTATVDQRLLTGEAQPIEKEIGDWVYAATVVLTGRLWMTVERAGSETTAAQIGMILNRTEDYTDTIRAQGQQIADTYTLPTLLLSGVIWPLFGPVPAMTLIWSPVGYNMRYLGPFSVLNFLHIFSRRGVLIKDGRALEALQHVDTIVFDKTGTLTLEQPQVGQLYPFNGLSEETLLQYAATAEYRQQHPIARAIVAAADGRELSLSTIDTAAYEVGFGITVTVGDRLLRVGSDRFLSREGIVLPQEVAAIQAESQNHGCSLVYVAVDHVFGGAIELQPTIRPEAKEMICALRRRKMAVYIISGDHEQPTQRLAEELGIEHYFAEILPDHKAKLVAQLRKQGRQVCFIGDGINDAIALKTAQVSISLCGASTVATDTAQIVLMDGTLNQLDELFTIAADFERNMHLNFRSSILSGGVCIGGVCFFHMGLWAVMGLCYVGIASGVASTMIPLLKYQKA